MAVVTMRQLLEAGVHFGHQTRRWNPKMKRFIFGERNGIYIIDLNQTLQRLEVAYSFVRDLVSDGGTVLFVGTKKQAQDPIERFAKLCGMPYVNERWLGGMLTNFATISGRVSKMQEFERMRRAGDFEAMPKKEALVHSRELEKLERNLGGIRTMSRLPDAVFVIDIKKEHIAISEAAKMGIPILAVVDTNCDPDLVQFPIPGNDDAIRSGTLMCRVVADAVQEGRFVASRRAIQPAGGPPPAPPGVRLAAHGPSEGAAAGAELAGGARPGPDVAGAGAEATEAGLEPTPAGSNVAGAGLEPAGAGFEPAGATAGPAVSPEPLEAAVTASVSPVEPATPLPLAAAEGPEGSAETSPAAGAATSNAS